MPYQLKNSYAHRSNYGAARNTANIKYIVWHYTGNDGDTAAANALYFKVAVRKASSHYFVDDNTVIQSVPDNYTAWSVGGNRYKDYQTTGGAALYGVCTNSNSVSIELCGTKGDGSRRASDITLANAVALTVRLMNTYHIPLTHVIRHFDVTGKYCPAYFMDTASWSALKETIRKSQAAPADKDSTTNAGHATKPAPSSNPKNTLVAAGQRYANNFAGCSIAEDGVRGPKTKAAGIRALQHAMNLDYHSGLAEDGMWGPKSNAALASHYVKYQEKQYMVTAAEILLMLKGYQPNGVETPGIFGKGLKAAAINYQRDHELAATGIINATTFKSLIV